MNDAKFVKVIEYNTPRTTWLIDINSISRIDLTFDMVLLNDGAAIHLIEESAHYLIAKLKELGMVIEDE